MNVSLLHHGALRANVPVIRSLKQISTVAVKIGLAQTTIDQTGVVGNEEEGVSLGRIDTFDPVDRKSARPDRSSVEGPSRLKWKVFVLTNDGSILQYSDFGPQERQPEECHQLNSDTTLVTRDIVPGSTFALEILSPQFDQDLMRKDASLRKLRRMGVYHGPITPEPIPVIMVFEALSDLESWSSRIQGVVQNLKDGEHQRFGKPSRQLPKSAPSSTPGLPLTSDLSSPRLTSPQKQHIRKSVRADSPQEGHGFKEQDSPDSSQFIQPLSPVMRPQNSAANECDTLHCRNDSAVTSASPIDHGAFTSGPSSQTSSDASRSLAWSQHTDASTLRSTDSITFFDDFREPVIYSTSSDDDDAVDDDDDEYHAFQQDLIVKPVVARKDEYHTFQQILSSGKSRRLPTMNSMIKVSATSPVRRAISNATTSPHQSPITAIKEPRSHLRLQAMVEPDASVRSIPAVMTPKMPIPQRNPPRKPAQRSPLEQFFGEKPPAQHSRFTKSLHPESAEANTVLSNTFQQHDQSASRLPDVSRGLKNLGLSPQDVEHLNAESRIAQVSHGRKLTLVIPDVAKPALLATGQDKMNSMQEASHEDSAARAGPVTKLQDQAVSPERTVSKSLCTVEEDQVHAAEPAITDANDSEMLTSAAKGKENELPGQYTTAMDLPDADAVVMEATVSGPVSIWL